MNPDQNLIHAAYEDAIRKLYMTLFDSYTQSAGDQAQHQAEQNFVTGVELARKARDRAIALLA